MRWRSIRWRRAAAALGGWIVVAVVAGCATPATTSRAGYTDKPRPPRPPRVGPAADELRAYIREHYVKRITDIPMRDGVRLRTHVYALRDSATACPILLLRTPYGIAPYGEDEFPDFLGPSDLFVREGYIFAYQDVRGRMMSEGAFENMRPHVVAKRGPRDIDESSDTYDTIDWLVRNVPGNNGRVGQWGISYPGFYASAGMIDAHPALHAVSPQAPIADWFFDDFFHHGAFFLPHGFNFFATFGLPRPEPTTQWGPAFDHGTPDGYQFFLDLGPLRNADARYFQGRVAFWNQITQHPNYDEFWQARNILPHLKNVAPAVMTVGGWFDAEDLYGTLMTYRAIERQNPQSTNVLVMGPWRHGGWSRGDGDRLGEISFGEKTSLFYRSEIELPFFERFLKVPAPVAADADATLVPLPEAYVFETGVNRWRTFEHWPPAGVRTRALYLRENGRLSFDAPVLAGDNAADEFISDPARPVPYAETIEIGMRAEYMTDDQRFAARRPDVLVYQTEPLTTSLTLAGPMTAELWVSLRATDRPDAVRALDADWIVKLIDVFPPDAPDYDGMTPGRRLGGYQMMVRSEVSRGRFRDAYDKPRPFKPGDPTLVRLPLQDVLHTFQPGHRVMIQVQSTWFPLVDRNPQKWVDNIFEADDDDFVRSTHRVHRGGRWATRLLVGEF